MRTPSRSGGGHPHRTGGALLCGALALGVVMPATAAGQSPAPTPIVVPGATVATELGAAAEMVEVLSRLGRFSPESVEVEVMIAPPEFFCASGHWSDALEMGADQYLTFVATQWHHGIFDGSPERFVPILRVDGSSFTVPQHYHLLADDGHRRTTGLVFVDLPAAFVREEHELELLMPPGPDGARDTVNWSTPIGALPDVDMGACPAGPPRDISPAHDHVAHGN